MSPHLDHEAEIIVRLAEALAGSPMRDVINPQILVNKVRARMRQIGAKSLRRYLEAIGDDDTEFDTLISLLSIHTTAWFRELPHFERLATEALSDRKQRGDRPFSVACAGCSSGEEVYSFALVFEALRRTNPGFEYRVHGFDVDRLSIDKGRIGHYPDAVRSMIPTAYRHLLVEVADKNFSVIADVRSRVDFFQANLNSRSSFQGRPFDAIVCRNCLIYFSPADVGLIIRNFISQLLPGGLIVLGHSESVAAADFGLTMLGNSLYRHEVKIQMPPTVHRKRILIVDDSKVVLACYKNFLEGSGYEVVVAATAPDADRLAPESFHLILLDLNMPVVDGYTWLKSLRGRRIATPVAIFTDLSSKDVEPVMDLLMDDAEDFIEKGIVGRDKGRLLERIAALTNQRAVKPAGTQPHLGDGAAVTIPSYSIDAIVVGASTGGPQALHRLLSGMPPNTPPVIVIQHISQQFSVSFGRHLAKISGLEYVGVCKPEVLRHGCLYVAVDDVHLEIRRSAGALTVVPSSTPEVESHRPSVDRLFQSCAIATNFRTIGVLLTGMGRDGAKGLAMLKERGDLTFAQDEVSSVVYGMPGAAVACGGVSFQGRPEQIRGALLQIIDMKPGSAHRGLRRLG